MAGDKKISGTALANPDARLPRALGLTPTSQYAKIPQWMWVISQATLRAFWRVHREAERRLAGWYRVVTMADWTSLEEVRKTFPSADQVGRCVVFNVGGNRFRVIARIHYPSRKVYIRAVLTHSDYDRDTWKNDDHCR